MKKIEEHLERTKIKPFIDKSNWEGINYTFQKKMIGGNLRKKV